MSAFTKQRRRRRARRLDPEKTSSRSGVPEPVPAMPTDVLRPPLMRRGGDASSSPTSTTCTPGSADQLRSAFRWTVADVAGERPSGSEERQHRSALHEQERVDVPLDHDFVDNAAAVQRRRGYELVARDVDSGRSAGRDTRDDSDASRGGAMRWRCKTTQRASAPEQRLEGASGRAARRGARLRGRRRTRRRAGLEEIPPLEPGPGRRARAAARTRPSRRHRRSRTGPARTGRASSA